MEKGLAASQLLTTGRPEIPYIRAWLVGDN
jgi:hypothetical protein